MKHYKATLTLSSIYACSYGDARHQALALMRAEAFDMLLDLSVTPEPVEPVEPAEGAVGELAGEDTIDSREVVQRIEELEQPLDELRDNAEALLEQAERWPEDFGNDDYIRETAELLVAREAILGMIYEYEITELRQLRVLQDEAEGYSDWYCGATLIRDDHFQDYAQELAEDIGSVPIGNDWPASYVDWAAAADALKQDYTSCAYGDLTYWVRS